MNEKPITLDLIPFEHRDLADFFICTCNSSHLVEDPIVCQQLNCQRMMCKSCYLSVGICPNCGSMVDLKKSQLPEDFLQILNPIPLHCENTMNGCLAKVQYETYRNHTRNCQFKMNATPTPTPTLFQNESKKFEVKIENLQKKDDSKEKQDSPSSIKNRNDLLIQENKSQYFSNPSAHLNITKNTVSGKKDGPLTTHSIFGERPNYFVDSAQTIDNNKKINENLNSDQNLIRRNGISSEIPFTKNNLSDQQIKKGQTISFSNPYAFLSQSETIFQEKKEKTPTTNKFCDHFQEDKEHQKCVSKPYSNASPIKNISSEKIERNNVYETFKKDQKVQSKTLSKTCSNICQKTLLLEERKEENQPEIKNEDLFDFNQKDYESLTQTQLRTILGKRNILKNGNKEELIKILKFYVENLKAKVRKNELFSNDKNDLSDDQLRAVKPEDFKDFTIENLRLLLSKRNIPKAGNKDDLILKLRCFLIIEKKPKINKNEMEQNSKKIKKRKFKNKSVDELKNMLEKKDLSEEKRQLIIRILERKKQKKLIIN